MSVIAGFSSFFSRNRPLKGVWREFKYLAGRPTWGGEDPFEWVTLGWFRRLYWDLVLRHRMPAAIEVEMNSLCNRRCSYCPVSQQSRPRGTYDFGAFQRLVDELATHRYHGEFHYNFYGEPMLDARIFDFVKYTRGKLPRTLIHIYSNGDYLTPEKFQRLVDLGVDRVTLSQHDPEPSAEITALKTYIATRPDMREKLYVSRFADASRDLSSRGGLIADARVTDYPRHGCHRARRATVLYDGQVAMCCEDYYAEQNYGNAQRDGFMRVWRAGLPLRRKIFLGEYTEPVCLRCTGIDRNAWPAATLEKLKKAKDVPMTVGTPAPRSS